MSEYQYYEFRAIDRPLSQEARAEIDSLSSRVQLTATSAIFTYSYGDFRGDPLSVLEEHFDILLYLANWGSRQIAFRLPRTLVDIERLALYAVEDIISIKVGETHVLLNIDLADADDDDSGWIEGGGWMGSIVPLRADLLHGDYRMLYLAWLAAVSLDLDLEEESEPPVPPNLGTLSASLTAFVDFFSISSDLIAVAAEGSRTETERARPEIAMLIAELPEQERNAYLVRVVEGDPVVGAELAGRLSILELERNVRSTETPSAGSSRTVEALFSAAEEYGKQRSKREAEQRRADRIRELERLGEREEQAWQEAVSLLAGSQWKLHEQAMKLFGELRDLAAHRGRQEQFRQRIEGIALDNKRRPSIIRRLQEAKLIARG